MSIKEFVASQIGPVATLVVWCTYEFDHQHYDAAWFLVSVAIFWWLYCRWTIHAMRKEIARTEIAKEVQHWGAEFDRVSTEFAYVYTALSSPECFQYSGPP